MAKKRYPVISILVAVVWATFFYPAEKKAPAPLAAKPLPTVHAVAAEQPSVEPVKSAPIQPFDPDALKDGQQDEFKVASRKPQH